MRVAGNTHCQDHSRPALGYFRTERLVLCRCGDLSLDGQRRQETRDLGRAHLGRMALAVEDDVAADPRDVGLLGTAAVMKGTDSAAHAVEQARLGWAGGAGFPDDERAAVARSVDPRVRHNRFQELRCCRPLSSERWAL